MAIPKGYLVPAGHHACACPTCGYCAPLLSKSMAQRPAKPGDLSLCMGCGAILRFDAALDLEVPGPSEMAVLRRQRTKQGRMLHLAQLFIRKDRERQRPPGERQKGTHHDG